MLTWPAVGIGMAVLAALVLVAVRPWRRWRRRPPPAESGHAPVDGACDAFVRECRTAGRDWPTDDLAWVVFSRMAAHVLARVPAYSVTVVVQWNEGGNVLIARPAEVRDAAIADAARRVRALRHIATTGVVLQQLAGGGTCTDVLLPLRGGGPALGWGVLALRRAGRDGFTAGEIALADRLFGLARAHIEQVSAAARERRAAELDPTTGVPNRVVAEQWLAHRFAEAARAGHPVGVVLVDIDGLGAINARHGQAAGDHCLRGVARALCAAAGVNASVGRYGGGTFIVLLPGVAAATAREVGERLRVAVAFLDLRWEQASLRSTVSVGLAARRGGEHAPQATLERAGAALRAAKRAGRNCVQVAPTPFS